MYNKHNSLNLANTQTVRLTHTHTHIYIYIKIGLALICPHGLIRHKTQTNQTKQLYDFKYSFLILLIIAQFHGLK